MMDESPYPSPGPSPSEALAGIALAILGALVLYGAIGIGLDPGERRLAPGLMPAVAGVVLIASGVLISWTNRRWLGDALGELTPRRLMRSKAVRVLALVVASVPLTSLVGFPALVLLVAVLYLMEGVALWRVVLLCGAMGAAGYFLFFSFLGLPPP